MTVSSRVFGENVHRSRAWVAKVVRDMERMGYKVTRDGKTTLFDDQDAMECVGRRGKEERKA